MPKIKICLVLTDKAQLSRLLTLMFELKRSNRFQMQLIVSGGALTYRYGNVLSELKRAGIKPDLEIPTVIEGSDHLGMAKTAALSMLEFATAINNLKSQYVIVRGDRFEVLPIATAASYLNKYVIHLEGGDRSGSIDESVRHAITKLAHIHFATNKEAKNRLIKLGENKKSVFNVGSLDIDFITKIKLYSKLPNDMVNDHGVGAAIDLSQPYLIVMQNPVTTEADQARFQINQTLLAINHLKIQTIWIWPNLDAGSDAIAKKMREWQVAHPNNDFIRFIRYLGPAEFINIVNSSALLVGNSSTGIKECSFLGVPTVNIGSRQVGRYRCANVVDVAHNWQHIAKAIITQRKIGRYKPDYTYGKGNTAKTIVSLLPKITVSKQKQITY